MRDIAISDEVTVEDFEAVNAESVADALTYVPGVQVAYGRKAFPSISIHGFDQNRILTLIDGVPYYEDQIRRHGSQPDRAGKCRADRCDQGGPVGTLRCQRTGRRGQHHHQKTHGNAIPVGHGREYGVAGVDDAYKASLSHGMKVGNSQLLAQLHPP